MENSSTEQLAEITLKKLSNRAAPSAEAVFLRRVSYGIAPDGFYPDGGKGDIYKFRQGGSSIAARVKTWINNQLNVPSDKKLTDIAPLISSLKGKNNAYRTLDLSLSQEWNNHFRRRPPFEKENRARPTQEREMLAYNRSVYSRYQLFERLASFWHNHFNVFAYGSSYTLSTWGSWDNTIRNHTLGNFYELLVNTAQHPAMLVYLDNYINTRTDPNENYAREVFELHTMGAMNYQGIKEQSLVPNYTSSDSVPTEWIGKPKGYVDEDVYEAARILTGWTIDRYDENTDTGEFIFREEDSDDDQKFVLGHRYRARGKGTEHQHPRFGADSDSAIKKQGKYLLWQLATHPGTAKHIAWKLVRHFLDDNADKHSDIINTVAKTFLANIDKPDQLKRCYLTLFNHPKMYSRSTWGNKKAPPTEMFMHALRAMGSQRIFREFKSGEDLDSSLGYQAYYSGSIRYHLRLIGNQQWYWRPPNGFPEESNYWLSTNAIVLTSRYINWLTYSEYALDNEDKTDDDKAITQIYPNTLSAFPDVTKQTPQAIVEYWSEIIWGFKASQSELQPIIDFFCRPIDKQHNQIPPWPKDFPINDTAGNAGIESNGSPHYWRHKLRALVSLMMSHPYAMLR